MSHVTYESIMSHMNESCRPIDFFSDLGLQPKYVKPTEIFVTTPKNKTLQLVKK